MNAKGKPVKFTIGNEEEVDWDSSGKRQNEQALARGLSLNRIEDGEFDPRRPNDYYFVTTEGAPGTVPSEPSVSRDGGGVWRMRFKDIERPEKGGTLELLLDGSEAPFLNKPDNMTIDRKGNLLIQEDPGGNAQLARIIAFQIDTGDRGVLAEFDPALFRTGAPGFITQDEESSGIIDARKLIGRGWFLFDAQVHKANPDVEKAEYGQLLALHVPKFRDVLDIEGDGEGTGKGHNGIGNGKRRHEAKGARPADNLNRALRAARRSNDPFCLLCHKEVREDEQRLRLRTDAFIHVRCATYRMRNRRDGQSRLGYPG